MKESGPWGKNVINRTVPARFLQGESATASPRRVMGQCRGPGEGCCTHVGLGPALEPSSEPGASALHSFTSTLNRSLTAPPVSKRNTFGSEISCTRSTCCETEGREFPLLRCLKNNPRQPRLPFVTSSETLPRAFCFHPHRIPIKNSTAQAQGRYFKPWQSRIF